MHTKTSNDPDPTAKLTNLGVDGAVKALSGKGSGKDPFPPPLTILLVIAIVIAMIAGAFMVFNPA